MATKPNARDAKIIQYLNEAHAKEKELETALQAHIKMTMRAPYKKRLQDHLKVTKAQAKGLQQRIRALGGKVETVHVPGPDIAAEAASAVTAAATRAVAAAKGPLHALRGTGEAEKLLKNAKTQLWNENEEIGNYLSIEALATAVGDTETAKLAREFRKQEERMAGYLAKLIPQLTKRVATDEIPAAERRSASTTRRRKAAPRKTARKPAAATASASSPARKASTSASPARKTAGSTARKTASTARRTAAKKPAASRSRAAKKS